MIKKKYFDGEIRRAKTSICSDNNYSTCLSNSVSFQNNCMCIGLIELPTVSSFDRYSNMSVYSKRNPTAYLSNFSIGQSALKASLHSNNNYLTSLDGSLSVANTFKDIYPTELTAVDTFHRYSNMNVYSERNPTAYLSNLSIGQSALKASLHSSNNYLTSLDGSLSVANIFMGIYTTELTAIGTFDRISNMNVYSERNQTAYLSNFNIGQSALKASLHSNNNNLPSLDGSLSFANTFKDIYPTELTAVDTFHRYSNMNVYSERNPTAYLSNLSLGQSVVKVPLHSDIKYLLCLNNDLSTRDSLKFVENLNNERINRPIGFNNYLSNSISSIKEFDVTKIGPDISQRENKDLERYIKKECQRIAEIVKIEPNHIGLEISETSQRVNVNIYFVFTGSFHDNNLQIGDKNIKIVNYGKQV